jgi:uncharacterized membrane protein
LEREELSEEEWMAKDLGSNVASMLGTIARELTDNVSSDGHGNGHVPFGKDKAGALSGARGVAAGAALATAVPLAGKAAKRLVGKRIGSSPADLVGEKFERIGDAPGVAKEVGKKMLPGNGGGEKGKKGTPGVGKGRRMPVQQAAEIGVPLSVAYNQWTQFEEWPQFMHRLDQATQEDECTVSFRTKLWGMSKEFVAHIVEQRPDERIQWTVSEGVVHTGVVTFHELARNLTRVQVTLDVEPGSLLEKAARGMRFVKRAVRADLARFKAFVEMQEVETGAWRGVIHDGELAEEHDRKYDRQRDYADFEDIHDRESSHAPHREERRKSSSGGTSSSSRSRSSSRSGSSSRSSGGGRSRTKKRSRSGSTRKRPASRS